MTQPKVTELELKSMAVLHLLSFLSHLTSRVLMSKCAHFLIIKEGELFKILINLLFLPIPGEKTKQVSL